MASKLRRQFVICVLLLTIAIIAFVYNKELLRDQLHEHEDTNLLEGHKFDTREAENEPVHQARKINSHNSQSVVLRNRSPKFEDEVKTHKDENALDLNNINSSTGKDFISRMKVSCSDQICSEFITPVEKEHLSFCTKKTWGVKKHPEPKQSVCSFINGTNRAPVALASYPGSGNTWVRGLLQEITGVCTGAVYCDITLRKNGYPGESIRSGATLVVKTHLPDPRWTGVHYNKSSPVMFFHRQRDIPVFSSGIFILRNPFDSFVAEYQRLLQIDKPNMHVSVAGREKFGKNKEWNSFVYEQATLWKMTINGWVVNTMGHSVLVVKYEDLVENTRREIKRILDFLQFPYSTTRLDNVINKGYSKYKRKHLNEFDHYTTIQHLFMKSVLKSTSSVLSEHGLLHVANISSYLQQ